MTSRAEHDARREAAYLVAEAAVFARAPVRFGAIDPTACAAFKREWEPHLDRKVNWDWHALAGRYARQHFARLELAIWSGNVLCGLVLGRFSRAETVLQLNFIEGAPGANPLRGDVLNLGVTFGEVLGSAYGSAVFRVTKPAPHVVNALVLKGFRDVAQSKDPPYYHYCEAQLP